MISLMAEMTAREEVCALVDASDAFDPHSADGRRRFEAAPVGALSLAESEHVGLVCLEQALKATDLLLAVAGSV
jgi:hypothetical protein